jgi:plasmid stabilization system protein ParE
MGHARRAALWSPEALADRERIWGYYSGVAGRHTAEKVLRGIADVIALIENHPLAGRARGEVRPPALICRHDPRLPPRPPSSSIVSSMPRRKSCACSMGGRISRRHLRRGTESDRPQGELANVIRQFCSPATVGEVMQPGRRRRRRRAPRPQRRARWSA